MKSVNCLDSETACQSVSQSAGSTAIMLVRPILVSQQAISSHLTRSTSTPRSQSVAGGRSVILQNLLCHNMNHYCTQRFWLHRRRLWRRKWWLLFCHRCAIQRMSLSHKTVSLWEKIVDCDDKWLTQQCFVEKCFILKGQKNHRCKTNLWRSVILVVFIQCTSPANY